MKKSTREIVRRTGGRDTEQMIDELRKAQFPGRKIGALLPDPQQGNQLSVKEWPPLTAPAA